MKRPKRLFCCSLIAACMFGKASAQNASPKLSFVMSVPSGIAKRLAVDGYALVAQKKFITWDDEGVNYFVLFRDGGTGCGVADFNENRGNYKILDLYDRCKIVAIPIIKDLLGDGSQAIVLRLRLHSNGRADVYVDQTNAYLYTSKSLGFCKNDAAGEFAAGIRLPNSVINFGPSTCY